MCCLNLFFAQEITLSSPVSYLILKSRHRKQKDAFLKSFPTPKVSKFVLEEIFIYFWFFRSFRFAQDYKGVRNSQRRPLECFQKFVKSTIKEMDLFLRDLIAAHE